MARTARLPFAGIDELGADAHVMVDGAGRPGSALVLSHWPVSKTPKELARDLSTEIVFAYLDAGSYAEARAVTCDHFDEDGLASVFTLVDPQSALAMRDRLIEFARIGDFGVVRDESAALSVLALKALSDRSRSPLFVGRDSDVVGNQRTTDSYKALLPVLPQLLTDPSQFRGLFEEEEQRWRESVAHFAGGEYSIEERDAFGLVIVTVEHEVPDDQRFEIDHGVSLPFHDWALHSATRLPRVLVIEPDHICYYDRYETWVRYTSRVLPCRRDLGPLALLLSDLEPGKVTWRADSPGALTPTLSTIGSDMSELNGDEITKTVCSYLETAPVGWDPFHRAV